MAACLLALSDSVEQALQGALDGLLRVQNGA